MPAPGPPPSSGNRGNVIRPNPQGRLQKVVDGGWTLLAQATTPHGLVHWQRAMWLWALEPNIVVPPVLRAEVTWEGGVGEEAGVPHPGAGSQGYPARPGTTTLLRTLIPRQAGLDRVLQQRLTFHERRVEVESLFLHAHVPHDLPFYCPKVWRLAYVFEERTHPEEEEGSGDAERHHQLRIEALPIPGHEEQLRNPKLAEILGKLMGRLIQFMRGFSEGYTKRVHHDQLVSKVRYQDAYARMKGRHKHWVTQWPEDTDPAKQVFEEIGIATFLVELWRDEEAQTGRRPTFLDLGCGNGFLTHLLTAEGYQGYGLDQCRRRLWDHFPPGVDLREQTFSPTTMPSLGDGVDWIVGNHPDELTLWIPVLAARARANFLIIPCCLFQLDGRKFTRCDEALGRYATYCQHVVQHCERCGFVPETEWLRIPSTKNLCIVGRRRRRWRGQGGDPTVPGREEEEEGGPLDPALEAELARIAFQPRVSDRDKTLARLARHGG